MPILPNEKSAIEFLRKALHKKYKLLDFKLYGSKARGTDHQYSDLDIMIVLEENTPEIESEIDDLIFEINLKYNCLITALYYSKNEIESGPFAESPVYKKILEEGIAI